MYNMYDDLAYVMITKEQIEQKVKEIAETLDREYCDKLPVMVCILKGSTPFYADLVRNMKIPVRFDFMSVSSYGSGTKSTGKLNMKKDLDNSIEGRHVVLVEDIMDSGNTLFHLKKLLSERSPASVRIVTLLDKPSRREVDISPDYCCFEIENEFVVGYGLDYDERYRNLPVVGVLKPEVYNK